MTEPQPELLGYAEQTPAEKHLAVSSQTFPAQKNVRFKEPDVHKE
jgi:hypothetical protein